MRPHLVPTSDAPLQRARRTSSSLIAREDWRDGSLPESVFTAFGLGFVGDWDFRIRGGSSVFLGVFGETFVAVENLFFSKIFIFFQNSFSIVFLDAGFFFVYLGNFQR